VRLCGGQNKIHYRPTESRILARVHWGGGRGKRPANKEVKPKKKKKRRQSRKCSNKKKTTAEQEGGTPSYRLHNNHVQKKRKEDKRKEPATRTKGKGMKRWPVGGTKNPGVSSRSGPTGQKGAGESIGGNMQKTKKKKNTIMPLGQSKFTGQRVARVHIKKGGTTRPTGKKHGEGETMARRASLMYVRPLTESGLAIRLGAGGKTERGGKIRGEEPRDGGDTGPTKASLLIHGNRAAPVSWGVWIKNRGSQALKKHWKQLSSHYGRSKGGEQEWRVTRHARGNRGDSEKANNSLYLITHRAHRGEGHPIRT